MRDKFSELIAQGVAPAPYKTIVSDMPETDMFCRYYNNLFSIPTDTHMIPDPDSPGEYIITGYMIDTPDWCKFINASYWGGYQICTADYWSLSNFLYNKGFIGCYDILNGEKVYRVKRCPEEGPCCVPACTSYTTSESKIPKPISDLVVNHDVNEFHKCMTNNVIESVCNLNNSLYVKGNKWCATEDGIVGFVNNKVVFL